MRRSTQERVRNACLGVAAVAGAGAVVSVGGLFAAQRGRLLRDVFSPRLRRALGLPQAAPAARGGTRLADDGPDAGTVAWQRARVLCQAVALGALVAPLSMGLFSDAGRLLWRTTHTVPPRAPH